MNLTTIGSIPSSNWKRIRGRYVSLATGVVLVGAAAVAFAPSAGTSTPVSSHPQTTEPALQYRVDQRQHNFYIVATEAERAAILEADAETRYAPFANEWTARYEVSVVVAGSAAADALVGEDAREMMAGVDAYTDLYLVQAWRAGVLFKIVDTTRAAVTPPPMTAEASEADIMASVLSTERAAYDFPHP